MYGTIVSNSVIFIWRGFCIESYFLSMGVWLYLRGLAIPLTIFREVRKLVFKALGHLTFTEVSAFSLYNNKLVHLIKSTLNDYISRTARFDIKIQFFIFLHTFQIRDISKLKLSTFA